MIDDSKTKKPILIYDGDCNFCLRWVLRWKRLTQNLVDYAPSQEVSGDFPQISPEDFLGSVQLVEPDGRIFNGAEAVFRTLSYAPNRRWPLWFYRKVPAVSVLSEWSYRLVARHRTVFSVLTRFFWGRHLEEPSYILSTWLFLRLLSIIYLIAFLSLGFQIEGLVGSQGIMPAEKFLEALGERMGMERFHWVPTLFWFGISDHLLKWLCVGGSCLSLMLLFGIAPAPIFFLLWVFYLSLSSVCRDFLSFQWDILLLECGFLAIFLAPSKIWPWQLNRAEPSKTILWLFRWLLFRLMFQSGCVKLLSGDSAWKGLTALNFHYETQPLPTIIGWYAHQLPVWFQKFSIAGMFAIELAVPFLIFLPRRAKLTAFLLFSFLQILIIITGNYCFFNWLTLALCLLLLDDYVLETLFPRKVRERLLSINLDGLKSSTFGIWAGKLKRFARTVVAVMIVFVSTLHLMNMFLRRYSISLPTQQILSWVSPYRSVNSYGLFAVMTTVRREIIIEGSQDGQSWSPYEFKWKPGKLEQKPTFVAPHQPRLDWQMWFASLGNYQNVQWFIPFLAQLLKGSPPVLSLLEEKPFLDRPPRYVRALIYDYAFTDLETKKNEGKWWDRKLKGLYSPVLSLR